MGILGNSNPKVLVESLLYLFGIHFALRAGMEHHAVRYGHTSQIKFHIEDSGTLRYLEYRRLFQEQPWWYQSHEVTKENC